MTEEELQRLEALAQAITAGPWVGHLGLVDKQNLADVEFGAASRDAIFALIAEVRRLRAVLREIADNAFVDPDAPVRLARQVLGEEWIWTVDQALEE